MVSVLLYKNLFILFMNHLQSVCLFLDSTTIFAAFAGLKSSDQSAALLIKTLFIFYPLQYFSLTQPAAIVFWFFFLDKRTGPLSEWTIYFIHTGHAKQNCAHYESA